MKSIFLLYLNLFYYLDLLNEEKKVSRNIINQKLYIIILFKILFIIFKINNNIIIR